MPEITVEQPVKMSPIQRAEGVLQGLRDTIPNPRAVARVGLLALPLFLAACAPTQVSGQLPEQKVEDVAPVTTSLVGEISGLTEQQKTAVAEALPGILSGLEAETREMPAVPERPTPLSAEEAVQLIQEFSSINAVVKNLVRPEALANNPDLSFDVFANDPVKIDQYRRAEYFLEMAPRDNARNITNPNDKMLFFVPQGGKGAIIVRSFMTADGRVYAQSMQAMLDQNGQVVSQFRETRIPREDLKAVATSFYNIPGWVSLNWSEDEQSLPNIDRFSLVGTGVSGNKQYSVRISERGYSGMTIEELPGKP